MIQCELIITSIVLVAVNIAIITMWILQFRQSNKHLKKTQIDFELAVQEQKRNQAESDVTKLRIKEAEFMLMPGAEREKKEWKDAIRVIRCRIEQYKECRVPEIENRIDELKREKEKCG